ncbi:ATP-binding cassette domain-containing protein [Anaerovorax odorimutans]|uniref:ATP-binding cassette domain-containing protein n=1 Tax=Anaerovorax odorimutans TaxID=109327 RepID=A0ABT1RJZ8_9FIRM|nr:ATP-binding cassette domain-containing protein [Anaerovorax odorimutans]MCQ4635499.1 ATP-binding cassette domain-containing protein [Anaerovorax odorimutans]
MLEITNLTKIFSPGTVNEKLALNKVNLSLKKGDFVTIIGSNGAGKSTLMNCIAGVHGADGGKILLDGQDITRLPEHRRAKKIGRVFQDPLKGTAFDMTIEENLSIAYNKIRSRGFQPGISKKDRELFREKLRLLDMGLEDRMKEKARLLSGGQRQALTLFMAVIARPKLLLLDEHTAALDPSAAKKVLELTDLFAGEDGMCTLMITHNMKAALEHGNRTILMRDGQVVMDITGAERDAMTVEKLIEKFEIDNDRMLL